MEHSHFFEQLLASMSVAVPILTHEYVLTSYGVLAWAWVWGKPGKRMRAITLGMSGGGAIIAWDDELLHLHNNMVAMDFDHWPFYLYIIAGFLSVWGLAYLFRDKVKVELDS